LAKSGTNRHDQSKNRGKNQISGQSDRFYDFSGTLKKSGLGICSLPQRANLGTSKTVIFDIPGGPVGQKTPSGVEKSIGDPKQKKGHGRFESSAGPNSSNRPRTPGAPAFFGQRPGNLLPAA
jgi:hypothetical protein